ncbi:MAG: putative membrane protein [Verrucomicrobiales bacterium]|jgi:uncharacterized membrane protein
MNRTKSISRLFRQLLARHPDAPAFLLVGISLAWCAALWLARSWSAKNLYYDFLPYNLSLAVIPLILSTIALRMEGGIALFAWLLPWLVFFPNAPYVLTDLIHLRPRHDAPFWFDWGFLVSCAGTGLLIGLVSLRQVYRRLRDSFGMASAEIAVLAVVGLSGFGIYLGRFIRWNSWDIATRPFAFAADIMNRVLHPFDHPRMVVYSICVAVMLTLSWFAFRIMGLKSDWWAEPD